ncbi:MAG: chromosome segregation protein SMC [Deltaproteobacteria bacterium]|nr:chromosome segregation protein SMC [Deltaproteobacteria bacterium]
MKLKKLEINGFKSFVDKASIQFPPGISAVVGPNGCGKSNIIDAIKWVMGEQSAKQLRGKSMEDIIFSGSNGKPALNMAEVSLTMANDNGTAPEELKDFTEIMLTRRLYRSGESGYFINKQPCRLKDIHNVFLGNGLGTTSYAVIQQGNIGAITDAGPEERRVLIEQAAGVTRYKLRKKEALSKVRATNDNIMRISDIITEINRQMAGLKRQARKAERYKKYQKRIRELDICLSLHHFDEFTRQIDEADALLKDLNNTDIEHSTRLKKLDAALEKIKFDRTAKNQEISDQKSCIFETQRNIDRMENDKAHLSKDVERLTYEFVELESASKNLEEKSRDLTAEIQEGENQNIRIQSEITSVRSTLDKELSASQSIKNELSSLNQELETCKANLMDLVAREAQYKNIYQNATNSKESLKRRLKRIDEEEFTTRRKVSELKDKSNRAKEHLGSCKTEIDDLKNRSDIIQKQLREKSTVLGEQVKQVQTLDLERNKAKSSYTALKKMEGNFEWYKDGVRALMKKSQAAKKDGAPDSPQKEVGDGILGLMADILEPEPAYGTAVEAVLGESLQYILVENQETAVGSIDYLQKTGAGRSGFIPVASVKNTKSSPNHQPDHPKYLLNHVAVKPGFEQIAEALLGHVVVTTDIKEAIDVFNNNGKLQTVVSQNGDLISHEGIMVGGSKDNLSGILAKKREIKDIEGKIIQLDQELHSARDHQKELESEVRDIESNLQKLRESEDKAKHNEVEAEKALYKASEDLKNALRHLEIVQLEQEQLLGEESDVDEEVSKYDKAVSEIENQVKNAQDLVSEKLEQISIVSSDVEAFDQKIIDFRLELTALNAKLENSDNTLKRLKEFQNDGIQRIEQISRELVQKKQRKHHLEEKTQEYEQTLSGMYDDMKLLEKVLENNEADYNAIDTKLKESDSTLSEIQNEREKILQKIRMIEIEQSQRLVKRENITNRLKESYHQPIPVLRSEFEDPEIVDDLPVDKIEDELTRTKDKIANFDDVNLGAIKEYEQRKERFDFLTEQREDLVKAVGDLHKVIHKINKISQERFLKTFEEVNAKLQEVFPRLFEGGSARLVLTEPDKPLETGIEYMIHPPGKKLIRMSLLSGGEKALSAISLIFSIFLLKPAAFCLMDEIDAPLDETNVFRFNDLLKIIGEKSQIIMITHNKKSMEFADTLFGITMEKKGISKIVSVNLNPNPDKPERLQVN